MNSKQYPPVLDPDLVGFFDAEVGAGGGYVWDAVLEYRVWLHPEHGAPDEFDGNDYFQTFDNYDDAFEFFESTRGTEEPIALILQREYIDENDDGVYQHITEARIAEWPVAFLSRPQRTANTIPNFFAADAPPNRLDVLRGLAD